MTGSPFLTSLISFLLDRSENSFFLNPETGEGVEFGSGDLKNINQILKSKSTKVLEVWEGHHNNGEKFYDALKYLMQDN